MGFSVGRFAKIWRVEDKGNYSVAQVSTSKKNAETGQYETDFRDNYVRLVGTAHTLGKNIKEVYGGTTIRISSCDVTNYYDQERQKEYTNYVIFGFEFPEYGDRNAGVKPAQKKAEIKTDDDGFLTVSEDADDELPFN